MFPEDGGSGQHVLIQSASDFIWAAIKEKQMPDWTLLLLNDEEALYLKGQSLFMGSSCPGVFKIDLCKYFII